MEIGKQNREFHVLQEYLLHLQWYTTKIVYSKSNNELHVVSISQYRNFLNNF